MKYPIWKSFHHSTLYLLNEQYQSLNFYDLYKPIFYVRRKGIPTLILVPMYNVHIWAISNE